MSEVNFEVIQKTQKLLGKYVKKPALTEKLLQKPPFRFLHDIIKVVIKETGFLKGVFSDDELKAENVKEKEAKIAFLTKLIEAVKTVSKTDLKVRPSKIIAGLEPSETNILLQTIAKAIDKKLDTREYVKQLKGKPKEVKEKVKEEKHSKEKNKEDKTRRKSLIKKSSESPNSTDRLKDDSTTKTKKDDESRKKEKRKHTEKEKKVIEKDNLKTKVVEDKIEEQVVERKEPLTEEPKIIPENKDKQEDNKTEEIKTEEFSNAHVSSAGLVRPKSARPKSGDRNVPKMAPPTTLRPPSVRPSSARPGAPRLRPDSSFPTGDGLSTMGNIKVYIEDVDQKLEDEESVVQIETATEIIQEESQVTSIDMNQNQGQLVQQIMEQIVDNGKGVEIEWGKDASDITQKEVTSLRNMIQQLTKTANPLGKLMTYLHEDLEAMHVELDGWKNMKVQLFQDIAKQKKLTSEADRNLEEKLDGLRREIRKQEMDIFAARSNILRNDHRIAELLANK